MAFRLVKVDGEDEYQANSAPPAPQSVFQVRDSKNTLGYCAWVRLEDSSQLALSFYHVEPRD